jgi:hypothetical protein
MDAVSKDSEASMVERKTMDRFDKAIADEEYDGVKLDPGRCSRIPRLREERH